jgi:hypothetical protein
MLTYFLGDSSNTPTTSNVINNGFCLTTNLELNILSHSNIIYRPQIVFDFFSDHFIYFKIDPKYSDSLYIKNNILTYEYRKTGYLLEIYNKTTKNLQISNGVQLIHVGIEYIGKINKFKMDLQKENIILNSSNHTFKSDKVTKLKNFDIKSDNKFLNKLKNRTTNIHLHQVDNLADPVSDPIESVELVVEPVESVELVVDPIIEPIVESVELVDNLVDPVSDPIESVELVVEPVESVKLVAEPIIEPIVESVELVVEPVESVELVVEPIESVKLVVEPVESVELVVEPVESVELVAEPVESVELVAEPVESVKLVAEPVAVQQSIKKRRYVRRKVIN